LSRIEKGADGYDLAKLTEYLTELKQRFPDKSDATLLLEPSIQYDALVAVMDRIRVAEQLDTASGRILRTELFPAISIGDAPSQTRPHRQASPRRSVAQRRSPRVRVPVAPARKRAVSPSRFPPSGPTKSFSHRMLLPGFCVGRSLLGAAGSRYKI
jgi:hypothetical protein